MLGLTSKIIREDVCIGVLCVERWTRQACTSTWRHWWRCDVAIRHDFSSGVCHVTCVRLRARSSDYTSQQSTYLMPLLSFHCTQACCKSLNIKAIRFRLQWSTTINDVDAFCVLYSRLWGIITSKYKLSTKWRIVNQKLVSVKGSDLGVGFSFVRLIWLFKLKRRTDIRWQVRGRDRMWLTRY